MKMKYRFAAILLTFAIFSSCVPSTDVSTEPSPSVELSSEPTAAVEMNYFRYTGKSSFYPLWAQPNSEFTVTKTQYFIGEKAYYKTEQGFTVGGYLEREDIEGREDIAAVGLYSTAAKYFASPNSKALYDENGHISEILYLYSDGEYHAEPPEGEDVPTEPPKSVYEGTDRVAKLSYSEDDINLSYEEYFSKPRAVTAWYSCVQVLDDQNRQWDVEWAKKEALGDWYIQALEDGTIVSQYFEYAEHSEYLYGIGDPTRVYYTDGGAIYVRTLGDDSEAETLYTAEDSRVISIGGNEIVLFFMTSDYKIYRLHLPSGTVDFMCDTAFDFEAGLKGYEMYIYNHAWEGYQDTRAMLNDDDYYREEYVKYWGAELAEQIANDDASYAEWAKRDHTEEIENWCSQAKEYMPVSGYFEILSNNDVRFTVMGQNWLPTDIDACNNDTDWFSHIIFGSGSYFYGDYVTYSAALGKFGAPWRALYLLNVPYEQWMDFDEFVDYFGGVPPHSGI